jgi:hypothetical protein
MFKLLSKTSTCRYSFLKHYKYYDEITVYLGHLKKKLILTLHESLISLSFSTAQNLVLRGEICDRFPHKSGGGLG